MIKIWSTVTKIWATLQTTLATSTVRDPYSMQLTSC